MGPLASFPDLLIHVLRRCPNKITGVERREAEGKVTGRDSEEGSLLSLELFSEFRMKPPLCRSVSVSPPPPSALSPRLSPSLPAPVGRASLHYTLGEKWLTFIFL